MSCSFERCSHQDPFQETTTGTELIEEHGESQGVKKSLLEYQAKQKIPLETPVRNIRGLEFPIAYQKFDDWLVSMDSYDGLLWNNSCI